MSARIFTIMMLALLVSAVMAGPKLSAFLPASNEIPGWQVDTKSDRGAYNDEGLYGLYDGDVPHLKEFGLQAAHQRMYKSASKRAIVDLMLLDSPAHAKALYKERTDGFTKVAGCKKLTGVLQEGIMVPSSGVTVAYFWLHKYVGSVSVFGTSAADQQAAVAFLRKISKNIASHHAKSK